MSEIVQLSDEWKAIRLGKATASRMADICAKTRTGWGASRANYKAQLVCERLTGMVHNGYQNEAMTWGIEKEPDARRAYEFMRDATVTEMGFVEHPEIPMSGASPDGIVNGTEGMIEIKCPITATHIETLLGRKAPAKYYLQMQWQMACTGREWSDYISYDPRMPESMQLFIDRVERDNACIQQLERDVIEFLAEVDATVAELRARYEGGPSPLLEALEQSVALEASP
jgi:putative phage-type endonuclease